MNFKLALCFFVFATLANAAVFSHPGGIDFKRVKPAHVLVERPDLSKLTSDQLKKLIEEAATGPKTERYPGYVKGTIAQSVDCGVSGTTSRITGGDESPPHKYPWMAAVFMHQGSDTYFCGGTLLNEEWILTAGHCVDGFDAIDVYLGAHDVRAPSEEGRLEFTAAEFFAHPDYNPSTIKNDIGLIRLPEPVNFTDIIRPICLPSYSEEDEDFAHLDAPASGWGKPSDDATGISPVLREVVTETITNLICKFELITITATNICISGKDGKSTCNGDSGGPLHLIMDDGRYKQIGITSFGLVFGCELGLHAAFTRTTSYLQFIETHTGLAIDP